MATIKRSPNTIATDISPCIKRLQQDLKHLKEEPICGANAEPLENDILTWYGIVLGIEGSPYEGIPIRFCLEFPTEYPNEPPKAYFETHIEYSGGAAYRDSSGRLVVCLNIFGNFGNVHTEWATLSEGWAPSYSVHTILLSMQALLLSDMLSNNPKTIEESRKSALEFKCPITKHDGSDRNKWFPKVITDYNLVAAIAASHGRVNYDVLRDFYICYVKKCSASDPNIILGYGIHFEDNGTFSSPSEYLCEDAFTEGNRRSSTNRPFEHWLPIYLSSSSWNKVRAKFETEIETIARRNKRTIPSESPMPVKVLKVCSSIMNNLVVEIMNNQGNITANDKFINGYIAFYRILLAYATAIPRLVAFVNSQLKEFIRNPEKRLKSIVPNLGELLIYLTIATEVTWAQLSIPFIEECDARNFLWYAIGKGSSGAKYPELANEKNVGGRAVKVFDATEVSRNLVMFQTKFSKVAKSLTADIIDGNSGLAPDDVRFELKDVYNMVKTVESWDAYFDWLEMPRVPENERDNQLVRAQQKSAAQRYHYTSSNNNRNNNRNYRSGY